MRNGIKLTLSLLTTLAVAFAVRFWMPRYLGPAEFGVIHFAEEFTNTFFIIVTLGTDAYIRKEIATRPEHASDFFGSLTAVRVFVSVLVSLLLSALLWWMNKSSAQASIVYVFCVGQFFFVTNTSLSALLHARGTVNELAVINAISKPIWGVGIVAGLLWGGGVIIVAAMFAATELLKTPFLLRAARRHLALKMQYNWTAAKTIVAASMPYFVNNVALHMCNRIDVTMVSGLTNDKEVGWYGAAINVTFLIFLALPVLNAVVMPMGARLAQTSHDLMNETMRGAVRFVLMLTVPVAVILALNADAIVGLLYTGDYQPTIRALRILAPRVPLAYMCVLFAVHLIELGRIWTVTRVSVISLVFNVVLNSLLLQRGYSMFGEGGAGVVAASTTAATDLLVTVLFLVALREIAVDRRLWFLVLRLLVVGLLVTAGHQLLVPWGPWRFVVDIVTYVILGFALKVLPLREILAFVKNFRSARQRKKATGMNKEQQ